jgi:hypothetical protein
MVRKTMKNGILQDAVVAAGRSEGRILAALNCY